MGLLLNVDYGEFLARARGWRVLRLSGVASVGVDEAIDAFYIHYRNPILGGRADVAWKKFVELYLNSPYYVGRLTRLNYRASLEAAVRLLRAFNEYLNSLESRKRAWFGRGRDLAWVEALKSLRRHFGDPYDLAELYFIFRKLGELLGRGRRGDPAALALSSASDLRRIRLAHILSKALRISSSFGDPMPERRTYPLGEEVERGYGSVEKIKMATPYEGALYLGAPPLFAARVASAKIQIRQKYGGGNFGVYLLVDKSGSMYSPIGDVEKITLAAAYAMAVLRRYRRVVLRFFDADVYDPVEDVGKLIEILTRVQAKGGTDITRAIYTAVDDALRLKLRRYVLVVVTDGEDEGLHPAAIKEAKREFSDVIFAMVSSGKPPPGVRHLSLLGVYRPRVHSVEGAPSAVKRDVDFAEIKPPLVGDAFRGNPDV